MGKKSSDHLESDDLNMDDKHFTQIAELGTHTVTSDKGRNDTMRFLSKFNLFQVFEGKLLNHDVGELKNVDAMQLYMTGPIGDDTTVDQIRNSLERAHIVISVNWMPLWQFDMSEKDIRKLEKVGDQWEMTLFRQDRDEISSITQRYEALLAESASNPN